MDFDEETLLGSDKPNANPSNSDSPRGASSSKAGPDKPSGFSDQHCPSLMHVHCRAARHPWDKWLLPCPQWDQLGRIWPPKMAKPGSMNNRVQLAWPKAKSLLAQIKLTWLMMSFRALMPRTMKPCQPWTSLSILGTVTMISSQNSRQVRTLMRNWDQRSRRNSPQLLIIPLLIQASICKSLSDWLLCLEIRGWGE